MYPYVSIRNGKLLIDFKNGSRKKTFPATKEGAHAAGRALRHAGAQEWLCSSSIDFPKDDGGADIDMRSALADGWMNPCEKCRTHRNVTYISDLDVDLCKTCFRAGNRVMVRALKTWLKSRK